MLEMIKHLHLVGSAVVVWLSMIWFLNNKLTYSGQFHLWLMPFYAALSFAFGSLIVIAYRVARFNNCNQDYLELKQEIEQARKDLTIKGFRF